MSLVEGIKRVEKAIAHQGDYILSGALDDHSKFQKEVGIILGLRKAEIELKELRAQLGDGE